MRSAVLPTSGRAATTPRACAPSRRRTVHMMQRLTRRVLAHKRFVALGWLLLTLIGIGAAGPASSALDQRFSVPGREGWDASQDIQRIYGNGGETLPLVPVVTLPKGTTVDSAGGKAQRAKGRETP